jgi:hypothetical protein
MKYTILFLALAVALAPFTIATSHDDGAGDDENDGPLFANGTYAPINVTEVVHVTYNFSAPKVCPLLVNYTYLEIYHNDSNVTADGGVCDCMKKDHYEVYCGFFYCLTCYNGICVGRTDIYDFGPKYRKKKVHPISYEREFFFLYEKVPFTVTNKQGFVIDEGNWTAVKIKTNKTSCLVTAVDDMDEETTMCTCEEVTCGNTTRYAYDCGGQKWGNCNSTLDNFDPDEMDVDDPLFVLNTNYLNWSDCFEEQST